LETPPDFQEDPHKQDGIAPGFEMDGENVAKDYRRA
jgi:hypothetical protein